MSVQGKIEAIEKELISLPSPNNFCNEEEYQDNLELKWHISELEDNLAMLKKNRATDVSDKQLEVSCIQQQEYFLPRRAVLVKSRIGTNGVDCWFDTDSDRMHRCITKEHYTILKTYYTSKL